jgi:chorismate mutase
MTGPFDDLRARITANDAHIVAAVNERIRLVSELWRLKQEVGADKVDPDREQRLREELAALNAGPLSAVGLDRLVSELLDLTKSEIAG